MVTFGPTSVKAQEKNVNAKNAQEQSSKMQQAKAKQSAIHAAVNGKGSNTYYKNVNGKLTRKTGKVTAKNYPADFPVKGLAGTEMPASDAGRVWEVYNLVGDLEQFAVKGEHGLDKYVYYFLPHTFVANVPKAEAENPFEEPEMEAELPPMEAIRQPVGARTKPKRQTMTGRVAGTGSI